MATCSCFRNWAPTLLSLKALLLPRLARELAASADASAASASLSAKSSWMKPACEERSSDTCSAITKSCRLSIPESAAL